MSGSRTPPNESNQEIAPRKVERAIPMRKVRILVNDPYATDSSDEESVSHRLFVREFSYPLEVTNPNNPEPVRSPSKKKRFFRLKRSIRDPVTGKYRGVKERAWGTFGAHIHDPFQGKRIWLGTYKSALEASQAYERKRLEFEAMMSNGINCSLSQKAMRESPMLEGNERLTSDSGKNEEERCKEATCLKQVEDHESVDALPKIGGEFDLDFALDSIVLDGAFVEPLDDLFGALGNADVAVADRGSPLPDIDVDFKDADDEAIFSWI